MSGYFRSPTIHKDTIVFLCEDDLWSVNREGGIARRLTANLGPAGSPCLSPDGELLAITGREEGPTEIYCMPALGGEAKRLTWQGAIASVVGWDGSGILYSSNAEEPFARLKWIWRVPAAGGHPERLNLGAADHISYGADGGVVLGRHTADPARWKRYRGGTAGRLWIDTRGSGRFRPLEPAVGNFTSPMWIGKRIYFISDSEGIGNLYSCLPSGRGLQRHTHHEEYYCRSAQTDGRCIVYHAGAELYVYDIESDSSRKVEVEFRSPRIQRQRKFVSPSDYLDEFASHPDGQAVAVTVRGKLFTMANWEGAVLQHGGRDGIRYRLSKWLNDGKRIVTISDEGGEEAIEIHTRDGSAEPNRLDDLDIGRPTELAVSPKKDQLIFCNHRFELLFVDLETGEFSLLDKSAHNGISGMSWSPDGEWLAYGLATNDRTSSIKICRIETGETWMVTPPEFNDFNPAWDPEGKFLYFLSYREFNPVYDHLHFDLGFPQAVRPLLVTLRKDITNPFVPVPQIGEEKKKDDDKQSDGDKDKDGDNNEIEVVEEQPVEIDFEDIQQRVVVFPYPEGRYGLIAGVEGKAVFTSFPQEGSLGRKWFDGPGGPRGTLNIYDFKEQRKDVLVAGIDTFQLSSDGKMLIYRSGGRLRAIKAGEKPSDGIKTNGKESEEPGRRSGWIDLNRLKVSIVPGAEWRQMYRDAWRLQREHFWTADMSGVDWERIYQRYLPQLERVATRGEFSDLMWEMQGELGTSHCYEMGGDYRPSPHYGQGFLGADFEWDDEKGGYRITHVVCGDAWEEHRDSPLNEPGINVREGDVIVAIGGQRLTRERGPGELLVNLANQAIELTILNGKNGETRTVTVKALSGESDLRYREFVCTKRDYVHENTDGKIGYVHIPDMGGRGYAEFHRGYLAELSYPGIIIDVRYNGGGHVSPLILEKLARKRVGYDIPRWGQPIPYPYDSVMGPIVAVTNENAGSDGDIFSHCFKLMGLGPLIGKRTWGGVIGISPQQRFVDGGVTTQPEYSFWFRDVGWQVENYGTDPDIEVEFRPQDYASGEDPQLDRAIKEILRMMKKDPPKLPDFSNRPNLKLPTLSKD